MHDQEHLLCSGIVLFWAKKFIEYWLTPLSASLVLMCVGFIIITIRRNRQSGQWMLGCGLVILLLGSNNTIARLLVEPLEHTFPAVPELTTLHPVPVQLAKCRYVVILGSGHKDWGRLPAVTALTSSSLYRLAEGMRIAHALPDTKLILSGAGDQGRPSHAAILAYAAESLGMPASRIMLSESPTDTEEEAIQLARMVGKQPFALVTSAWHMPRALAIMRYYGLDPLPCPTDYLYKNATSSDWTTYLWSEGALDMSNWALHERLGEIWYRLRGRTDSARNNSTLSGTGR